MKQLNVGCGADYRPGWTNVDGNPLVRADIHHDLNSYPYPFASGSIDVIYASHILEHLHDPLLFMKECHRLLVADGMLEIRVPHCSRGFTHWEHKRGFDVTFPFYFDPRFTSSGYTGIHFQIISTTLRWFALAHLGREFGRSGIQVAVGVALDKVISWLANLSPFVCSRIWCYWVGGFDEIQFCFKPGAHLAAPS